MALLITPGQLSGRAELFHQLSQVTASGLGLIAALELLHRNPPRLNLREPVAHLLAQLKDGQTFGDSLDRSGRWLSSFDVALLQAGEKSGRLPECFRALSSYYTQQAQLARNIIGLTAYPLIVFHLGVLIFPVSTLTDLVLKGAVVPFFLQKLLVLGPLYGLVAFLLFSLQSTRAETWRALVEKIAGFVPVLGTARRSLAIARLSLALESLINAGVNLIEAWEMAAAASGSPALRRVVARSKSALEAGTPPSEMVASHPEFPSAFASLYQSGEVSGTLDESLRRCHVLFEEEGARKTRQVVFGLVGLVFGAVILLVAWNIIKFWLGYFQQINDAINMNAR